VVLVGEPIFRLKANVDDLLADEAYSAPPPQVAQHDSINQFIGSDSCVSRKCALGLHLPSDAHDPEKSLGIACRLWVPSPGPGVRGIRIATAMVCLQSA